MSGKCKWKLLKMEGEYYVFECQNKMMSHEHKAWGFIRPNPFRIHEDHFWTQDRS